MGFHWGLNPSQINEVVTDSGSEAAATTASLLTSAAVQKKGAKSSIKAKAQKGKATSSAKRVVGFELIFTNSITRSQLTVRVPTVGAFHDPKRLTTLGDVREIGKQIAAALNRGFHEPEVPAKPRPRK